MTKETAGADFKSATEHENKNCSSKPMDAR